MLREEKAQEAVGSACPELWGLLSSHMLEPRPTSESSEKNDRPLIHNVAYTQPSRKVTRKCFQPKTLLLGTKSTNTPNTECQRTSEKAAAEVRLLKQRISKAGEIVYSVNLTCKHEDLIQAAEHRSWVPWDTLGIRALVRQTDGSLGSLA